MKKTIRLCAGVALLLAALLHPRLFAGDDLFWQTARDAQSIASEEKYVFFDNFDPIFAVPAYYDYLEASDYGPDFYRTSFSDDFFASHSITDFEAAIIPLGNSALNVATNGGIRIIDKINEMLDAGKKVMIISRIALMAQDGLGNDPDVGAFLENTLGVDYIGRLPVDGSGTADAFRPFIAKGEKDPVGNEFAKDCNGVSHGVPPLSYYSAIDVFRSRDPNKFKPVDYLLFDADALPSDTLLGIRAERGAGKVVFWSVGMEVMCHSRDRENALLGAMRWALRKSPGDGPTIEFLANLINFGTVEVGDTATAAIATTNAGDAPMTIDSIYSEDWAGGIFDFSGSFPSFPVVLQPDQTLTLKIKFMPEEEDSYSEFINILSDAVNAEDGMNTVELRGFGGIGTTPTLSLSDKTIDFGEVPPLTRNYAEIQFKNIGNVIFYISYVDFEENDDNAFAIVEGGDTPIILDPGQSSALKIKFVALKAFEEYRAKIIALSNASNLPRASIELIGKGRGPGLVEEWTSSADRLLKIKTTPNPAGRTARIYYQLGGNNTERVKIIIIDDAGRQVASLVDTTLAPGSYSAEFDASSVAAGIYGIIARAGGRTVSTTLAVVK